MSGIINGYCTLAEFLRYITPPGQTLNEDAPDDTVIEQLIMTASRRVEDLTGKLFYPRIETYYYDLPSDNTIWFGDDLLAVNTLTNGDLTTIASTDYILLPANKYPKYGLRLRDTSSINFVSNSSGSYDQVIKVDGMWGLHEWYSMRAWKLAGTLSGAWASTTTLIAALNANHTLEKRGGHIIRIDNELFNLTSASLDTLTVLSRGDNGSTAATHVITSSVYVWQPMDDIKMLAMEIANYMYHARYGGTVGTSTTYTPSAVVVTPSNLPPWAQEIITKYREYT